MKKFLSIFIAVAMVLSFASVFGGAPVAKAANGLDRAASGYTYIDTYPGPTGSLVQNDTTTRAVTSSTATMPIYTMGDYIDGSADDGYDTVELRETDGTTVVQTSNIAANRFRLPTDNVQYDGAYGVWEVDTVTSNPAVEIGEVFIKYNITIDQTSMDYCKSNYISGYVKHGDGTGATGAAVAVLYPDGDYLVYATVDTHGQFGMTIGPNDSGVYERGVYSIAVIDDYFGDTDGNGSVGASDHNGTQNSTATDSNTVDAFIYKSLYTTTLNWTLDTYIDPTILYESAAGEQTFVLKLLDDTGAPVTGEAGNFSFTGWTESSTFGPAEVSPGFYLFAGTVDSGSNYVKVEVSDTIGGVPVSASKTLAVTPLGLWNPQVAVDAYYSIPHYGMGPYCQIGREVYDKLPCTIGNSLEIYPILYKPFENGSPATHYEVHSWSATVNGPVTLVDDQNYLIDEDIEGTNGNIYGLDSEGRYLVNTSGKISVHFDGTIWEMADYSCDTFEEGLNACCHPFEADFNICEVSTCTVDSITQAKNDDGTYDISIAISGDPNNVTNCELCDQIVAHVYTIDDVTDCGPNGDLDLWYNPLNSSSNPDGTGIDDLPITFSSTNVSFERDGNTLILKGVDLSGLCNDTFVVQVFGTETRSQCAGSEIIHPLIYENTGDITSPVDITDVTATADVDTLVAGVCQTVTITAPDFSGAPDWSFSLNGVAATSYTMVDMGDGTYKVTLSPALSKDGTFEIVGTYATGTCSEEKAVVDISVELPEFTVQLGLKDGATIDNDEIITEGFVEKIYVTATDPRDGSALTLQEMSVSAVDCDCGIPSSVVYGWHPEGCEGISPLSVIGLDNPNIDCDPQFDLYVTLCGAGIYVDTFTLVPPTISADPTEDIPFYGCATCGDGTIVTFGVTDAHEHGVPNAGISVTDSSSIYFGSAFTGPDGLVKFNFSPTYQGNYYVKLGAANGYAVGDVEAFNTLTLSQPQFSEFDNECVFNNWIAPILSDTTQILTTVYKEPVKDTEPPVLTLTAPEDGATVATDMVTVKGTVTDNVGVTELSIGAMKVDFAPDGSFSADYKLAEGENTLKVFASDAAGNKAEKDITITYKPVKKIVVTVQIGSDVMTVNGEVKQLDVAPVILPPTGPYGHTYLPLRAIAEALGAKVDWIADTKGITLTLGNNSVGLQIGNISAVVNGNVIPILKPFMQPYGDGTYAATMVPLRVIAEGLGSTVTWDPATRVVTITFVQP